MLTLQQSAVYHTLDWLQNTC